MQNQILLELKELITRLIADNTNLELIEQLENYHDSDIADILETLSEEEQLLIYNILGTEKTADNVAYYENV
jgi:Mg/Co/Ni transporter MgtE